MAKQDNNTTPPKIDKEAQKQFNEFLKTQEAFKKSTREISKDIDKLSDSYSDMANVLQNVVKNAELFGEEWDDIADVSRTLIDNLSEIGDEYYEQIDLSKKLEQAENKRQQLILDRQDVEKELARAYEEELKVKQTLKDLEDDLLDAISSGNEELINKVQYEKDFQALLIEELQTQKDIIKGKLSETQIAQTNLTRQQQLLTQLDAQNKVLDAANKKANELGISVKEMADEIVTPFQNAVDFLDKVPGGALISKAFGLDSIMDKVKMNVTKSFTESLAATGSVGQASFAALRAGAMSFMTTIIPILPILLAVAAAAMAIKAAFEMDQEITDMARGLGVSKDQAHEIHSELLDIAETTKVVGASGKELGTAYTELAKSMGVTKLANAEMAETQVLLTKHMGMASEEATAFQKMSMAGGKSSEQNMAVIKAGVESMTGGLMSYKDVAKDIAKSSKAVQASYKGNIAALTKAVVTAKKFGMTLEDTKSSADGLLDIESSLEAEMKANVLTGKHMNLNKARELALQGESAEAVEEMMKQAGGYDELMDMAPYKQKALADAMNMTVEQMIEAAETQKNMQSIAEDVGVALGENGKYTEEQLKQAEAMGNEEAKKLLLAEQTASAQEKMSAIGDKLMAVFSKLADPIMEMLDPLMEAVDFLFPAIKAALDLAFAPIKYVMGLLSGIVKIFKGDFLGGIHDIGAAIIKFFLRPYTFVYDLLVGFFPSIGKLVDNAIGWVKDKVKGLLPNWALKLLGMGDEDKSKAADPAAAESSVKVDDALIRPGMPPIKFNEDDIIMAGTNLLGESSSGASSPTTNPMSEVVSLLKELIAKVDQPLVLNIGSRAISEIESQTSMKRSISTTADKSYGTFGT